MQKRKLKIINFLYLSVEKYNKIREYRNQDFIREFSFFKKLISIEEHKKYKEMLEEKENHFAFLITKDDYDYSVITLKKIDNEKYSVGEYLIKEEYKYEGGGIVTRFCMSYLLNNLKIKFIKSSHSIENRRGYRSGIIAEVKDEIYEDGYLSETIEVLEFNHPKSKENKARKCFDKIYEIVDVFI